MRNAQRHLTSGPMPLMLLLLAGCVESGTTPDAPANTVPDGDPAVQEIARSAGQGLPVRLVPGDFGTPEYVPPRDACAAVLRDPDQPGIELRLTEQYLRRDQWEAGDTTVTARYAEGVYEVSPTAYGLQPGDLLRVNCARQSATAVLSPITSAAVADDRGRS